MHTAGGEEREPELSLWHMTAVVERNDSMGCPGHNEWGQVQLPRIWASAVISLGQMKYPTVCKRMPQGVSLSL